MTVDEAQNVVKLTKRPDAPILNPTPGERRIWERVHDHPSWLRAFLTVIDHADSNRPWGRATLVIKHGDIVMVTGLEEDVKTADEKPY
jgi:hypothetical protein